MPVLAADLGRLVDAPADAVACVVDKIVAEALCFNIIPGQRVDLAALPARPDSFDGALLRRSDDLIDLLLFSAGLADDICPRDIRAPALVDRAKIDHNKFARSDFFIGRVTVRYGRPFTRSDDRAEGRLSAVFF